jgi:chromosome segregation ATPase
MDSRYRLAPMREARTRDEWVKRGDLAGAVGDARASADEVEAAARRVERASAAIAEATEARDRWLIQGGAAGTFAHLEHHLRRLRHDLDAARAALVRAQHRHRGQLEVVDEARARLTLARAEREVIERHFAAWRVERRKLAERRAD